MLNTTKRSGRKIARKIDKKTYGRLLAETLPEVIETEAQNRRMNAIADRLQSKRDRSPEEDRLLKLIATLCMNFEEKYYNVEEGVTPASILADLMSERGLKQADLLPIFGSSSVVSEVLSGKRGVTKTQAKALARFFKLPVELFL
ncbi:MAG TPA: transcriptional regulator [Blastocatellia bacterium]|jgi:HTH-type transcriptional regulator/antitoxin HigA|nr:transcriptional regulator [Blastocatellia bacterium]